MNNLLKGQEGVAAIQDDIIVFGRSVAEHDARLQQVFETIEKSGLKLNEKKCEIRKPKICYFGNVVSEEGMSPYPDKVKAIQELSAPHNVPTSAGDDQLPGKIPTKPITCNQSNE